MGAAAGVGAVGSVVGGIAGISAAKKQAAQIQEQGEIDAQNAINEGKELQQNQKMTSTGAGFMATPETSTFDLLVSTETEYKKQAQQLRDNASTEAKNVKTAAKWKAISGVVQGSAGLL